LRLSVLTPIVTRTPQGRARWEAEAGPEELAAIARAADRLGYHHMNCSEHVIIPEPVAEVRGSTYWDPLATFGYLAAQTERIRFATHVLVLGYHHPLELAKRYGTLDRVSGGRVILGVGVGSLQEEFELLGAPFADRGARADDALLALRASLGRDRPVYDGPYYRYEGVIVDPCAVQQDMPIWIGGRTLRSLRRAVRFAEGWAPFGISVEQMTEMLGRVERPAGFEVVYGPQVTEDPAGDPEGTAAALAEVHGLGVTIAGLRLVHHSLGHYLEQLEALQEVNRSTGLA
jgi:probable F420-dependent oxidoreductase